DIDFYADLRYRENRPGSTFYNYTIGLNGRTGFNFGGVRQFSTMTLSPNFTWKNYWRTFAQIVFEAISTSDALTRGGPLMQTPQTLRVSGGFESNDRLATSWGVDVSYRKDDLGGWGYGLSTGFTARPTGQWSLSIGPEYVRSIESRQYLTERAGGGAATFGRRYLFSFIDRSTMWVE